MPIGTNWLGVAMFVALALFGILLALSSLRKKRTQRLRDQFGREYDHAVRETGSRAKAERELLARTEAVQNFDIRALTRSEHSQFVNDWKRIEQRFVDRPTTAVAEADELVAAIMRTRGYPMGDFEKHAAHLSVTHPRVVEHYRAGHRIIVGAPGSASTEDLRQAMLHYRALFEELTGGPEDVASEVPLASEVSAPPRAASTDRPRDEDPRPSDTSR